MQIYLGQSILYSSRVGLPVDQEATVSIFLNPPLHGIEVVRLGLGGVHDIAAIAVQE